MRASVVILATISCASLSKGYETGHGGDVSGRDLATPEYELSVPATLCARRETGETPTITVHDGRCDGILLFQIAVTNPRFARKSDPRYTTIRNERRSLRGVSATDLLRRDEATGSYSRDLSFFTTDDLVVLNDPAQRYGVVHLFYEGLDEQRRKVADDVIDGVVPFRTPLDRFPRR
jgi:hypothetical protein